ncbi:MAG: 3-hydroxyacyl-CoA dehydrogenase NAD-binding domain-containing protein [Betaproteobacteria bacterium]
MDTGIESVLVYGYGVMGRAVARTFAGAGFRTFVKSRRTLALDDLPGGAVALDRLPARAPDLVIELVAEDVLIKQAVFAEIEAAYPEAQVVIATGTSGLDLIELGAHLRTPARFIGLHYFMPAETSRIVEVMAGAAAPRALVDRVAMALERTGKEPVRLYQPTIGFLVNRLQHALLHEAYALIEAGVATAAEIDQAARGLLGPRMCITGLVQQKDISGLAIHAHAQRSIVPALHHDRRPNPMLQAMVSRGETGAAAGRGFYDWAGCDVNALRERSSARLGDLMRFLDESAHAEAPLPQARRGEDLISG